MTPQEKRRIHERACVCMLATAHLGKELANLSGCIDDNFTVEQQELTKLFNRLKQIAEEHNAKDEPC